MTKWRKDKKVRVYSSEEIEKKLGDELPNWHYENGWIRRKYQTSGWKGTLMVVNTVGHIAEAAFHHPDLNVSYAFVVVKLVTHSEKGVTDKDFALAQEIERVVTWRPEADSPLEGTPQDARFKYIKYELPEVKK